jgi:hypothetical protein
LRVDAAVIGCVDPPDSKRACLARLLSHRAIGLLKSMDPRWRLSILIVAGGSIIPLVALLGADWSIPGAAKGATADRATRPFAGAGAQSSGEGRGYAAPTTPHPNGRMSPRAPSTQAEMAVPSPQTPTAAPSPPEVRFEDRDRAPIPPVVQPAQDVRSALRLTGSILGAEPADAGVMQNAADDAPAPSETQEPDAS